MSLPSIMIATSKDRYGLSVDRKFRDRPNVRVTFVEAPRAARVFRLLRKGSISARFLWYASLCRARDLRPFSRKRVAKSAQELNTELVTASTDILIMFRMGIILPEVVLRSCMVINVHVAKLPLYSGLGSIRAALDAEDYAQCATAHIATSEIDAGLILFEVPYLLDPKRDYCSNEARAYQAGIDTIEQLVDAFSVSHDAFRYTKDEIRLMFKDRENRNG